MVLTVIGRFERCLCFAMGGCLLATAAVAAAGGKIAQPSESLFIAQVVLLVLVGRLAGELMVRIGQPSIMGQIIAGILLGPSVLGMVWPAGQAMLFPHDLPQQSMVEGLAQLGILFLLLLAGMETDLGLANRLRRVALGVSITGIAIPFVCGFALGQVLPDALLPDPAKRLVASLFLGTALSISSVKIVASVVREMDFMRRNIGQLIVASAIIDDTIGWVIIAITFSLATSGAVDLVSVAKSVIGTLAFMAFSFTVGRRLVSAIIRWTNDTFRSDLPVLSAIIAIMGGMAMITHAIGVHTVLGAFVAGILVGESPILTRQIDEQLRALTTALFMPVFFGLTGLHTDLTVLANSSTLALAVGLILIASIGKFGGAFAGAKFGRLSNAEALALGCGMNARGSTEVIVASIGLSAGVLDQRMFSVIVAMAVVTTMAMPPTLRWALARLPMREEERARLKREEYEDESYVSQFERVLLAIDNSAGSDLAARLAGLFAGARKTPVTVLNISDEGEKSDGAAGSSKSSSATKKPAPVETKTEAVVALVRASADEVVEEADAENEALAAPVHIGAKTKDAELTKVLTESSAKGHDLLFIGVEPSTAPEGGFHEQIGVMTSAFKGATAIVSSRGTSLPQADKDIRLLVPISGTDRSIRAAEFAFVIAKATGCKVTVLYVRSAASRGVSRLSDAQSGHIAVFDKVKEIASFYDLDVQLSVQEGSSPEVSILRHARRGRYNLIVLGVSPRAGEKLSYGPIADTLLETSDRSLVFFLAEERRAASSAA